MDAYEQISALESVIANRTGVTVDEVRGRRRDGQIGHARAIIWALAYDYLGFTFNQIARVYGRDHTTIISIYYRIKKQVNIDGIAEELKKEVPGVLEKRPTPYLAKTKK